MAVGRADSGATEGKRVAPAFNTGGGGFEYEDLVGAWVAAGLAAGASPLGVEIGVPRELRFQAAASGSTLDDIVITGDAEDEPRWCASIKSFDMLVGSKLPDEFVDAVALVGPKERFAERLDAFREAGATTLLISTRDPAALRAVAELTQ